MLHAALEDWCAEDGWQYGDDDLNDGFPGFFFHNCDVFNFEHKDTKTQRLNEKWEIQMRNEEWGLPLK